MSTMWKRPLACFAFLGVGAIAAIGADDPPRPRLEALPPIIDNRLREISGMAASRQFPDTFWVHNDSGNPAELFAVDGGGNVLARYAVAVPNLDWEEVSIDDGGRLYLADTGNNLHILPLRTIHEFAEPNPRAGTSQVLRPARSFVYQCDAGDFFDAEAIFPDGDNLVVIEKRLDNREARLWEVSRLAASSLAHPAKLARGGLLAGFREPVTGASITPNGRFLAVCSTRVSRVYERGAKGSAGWTPIATAVHPEQGGFESVTWDGPDVVLATESGLRRRWVDPCQGKYAAVGAGQK